MKFTHALILASSLAFFACGDDESSTGPDNGTAECSVTEGVKVVSPKGGETFKVGETITVAFCSDMDFGGFGIELRYEDGSKPVNLLDETIEDATIDGKTVNEYKVALEGVKATDEAFVYVYPYSKQAKAGTSGTFKVKE